MTLDAPVETRAYINLQLSYRGSERQAPSALSLALTFSAVMQEKADKGHHKPGMSTEERLKAVLAEFHSTPGMLSRYRVEGDRERAVLNLLQGTTKETRAFIQGHLDFHKWCYSVFTSELLRSNRWLVGATPRNCKDVFKSMLCVSGEVQAAFIGNIIQTFSCQTRKIKLSSRAKFRPSQQEWDSMVDYTCIMTKIKHETEETLAHDPESLQKVLDDLESAFTNRPSPKNQIFDYFLVYTWLYFDSFPCFQKTARSHQNPNHPNYPALAGITFKRFWRVLNLLYPTGQSNTCPFGLI